MNFAVNVKCLFVYNAGGGTITPLEGSIVNGECVITGSVPTEAVTLDLVVRKYSYLYFTIQSKVRTVLLVAVILAPSIQPMMPKRYQMIPHGPLFLMSIES